MTFVSKHSDPASIQLDAVLKSTEEAAHHIMDAADELQKLMNEAKVDQAVKDRVTQITSNIYAACNFQDLTGQRITKVMSVLQVIESQIQRLIGIFSLEEFEQNKGSSNDPMAPDGPELPNRTQSQEAIDAIMRKTK